MTDEFLRALIQGPQSRSGASRSGADPLSQLLQGLMGGTSAQGGVEEYADATSQEMGAQSGAPGLGGLLEAIMGGGLAGAPSQESAGTGGGLADILGAVLGGGGLAGAPSQASAGTGGGLADILGAILGGGTLGATSGATSSGQSNPIISAIVTGLADKLGLPPQLAQIVVTFVMSKLLKGRAEAGASSQPAAPGPYEQVQPQAEGLNLDGLLDKINRGQSLRQTDLRATGMVEELMQQTGLTSRDASASLAYVLNELGSQYGSSAQPTAPSAPKPQGLDGLLDTWR